MQLLKLNGSVSWQKRKDLKLRDSSYFFNSKWSRNKKLMPLC